jgi:hypothetical protein
MAASILGATVTVTVVESKQPKEFLPITEYVVVVVGDATGLGQVLQLKLANGDHEYETAPVAVSITLLP